ncbi:MAG TPA: glycosyltransferase WbuB, partial [Rhodanobacter sp.]|nr:glycosyltransferase WbuB [Rhodanobacter sp.]
HNIPGKFLTYMQSGLPVIASVNSGNDLIEMIRSADVGYVSGSGDPAELASLADRLFGDLGAGVDMSARCKKLFSRLFTTKTAVQQLVGALRS